MVCVCVLSAVYLWFLFYSVSLLSVPGDALETHHLLCVCGPLNLIDQVVKALMSERRAERKQQSGFSPSLSACL